MLVPNSNKTHSRPRRHTLRPGKGREWEHHRVEENMKPKKNEKEEEEEVGGKRQVHASSMRARSFFHNICSDDDDDEAMRTSRIMERMVCIQAVRWRDAAAAASQARERYGNSGLVLVPTTTKRA